MASNSDPWRPRRLHPSFEDVMPPASGKPSILPGVTPSWPGHEYGPTPIPAPAPSTPGLPGGVRRTREELEALRDDAAREFHASEHARVQLEEDAEYQVRKPARAAQGVWAVAAWLLGELQNAPISGEIHDYPYTKREVGAESVHARDCIEGNDWPDLDRDYAAGVDYTVGWAFWPDQERPVPAAA
ncbi:hypothetical protein RM863_38525 [Streptomyces sp. DSM 41014]|uniref:Uncharacterized protein n=1 Tax=Streptomyces hintoniae TaxID=3075521 RepID=A0ABU2UXK7_9ACTN|nr:hypothetical protein [Streptomyces sp. DSM 41014]MDT0478028.1 hypothetical protein [Streptomyces sp. DSM 41014]